MSLFIHQERILHPSYDVALLRLSEPVQFSYKAAPVCMPQQHSALLVGEETTVSGWGATLSGKIVVCLQF